VSVHYTWVNWNTHKRVYDALLAGGVALFLGGFIAVGTLAFPPPNNLTYEILLMRALAACAFVLLHVILCIGPLARLTPRLAPLLYNRRHMGVTMFLLALAHAALAVGYYGGFGVANPILAVLAGPFEVFGFLALLILFLMAATSHDFWLANLSPSLWKSLHMGVYVAYALLVLHVTRGALRSETNIVYPLLVGSGILLVAILHIAASARERRDRRLSEPRAERREPRAWLDACAVDDIPDSRARIVCLPGRERVALFRDGDAISAVSNVCAHQGGPLGEGRIVGGCITCPWHGYQYLAKNGQSPPPYTEKIPTYRVRIEGRRVLLDPEPLPPGTPVEPARVTEHAR
jgi:nitrite reductase/ring-hydroxylating ferredoxin subunit/DMSO/TMAO reductase YedYZ heme-binding membrane subunit